MNVLIKLENLSPRNRYDLNKLFAEIQQMLNIYNVKKDGVRFVTTIGLANELLVTAGGETVPVGPVKVKVVFEGEMTGLFENLVDKWVVLLRDILEICVYDLVGHAYDHSQDPMEIEIVLNSVTYSFKGFTLVGKK